MQAHRFDTENAEIHNTRSGKSYGTGVQAAVKRALGDITNVGRLYGKDLPFKSRVRSQSTVKSGSAAPGVVGKESSKSPIKESNVHNIVSQRHSTSMVQPPQRKPFEVVPEDDVRLEPTKTDEVSLSQPTVWSSASTKEQELRASLESIGSQASVRSVSNVSDASECRSSAEHPFTNAFRPEYSQQDNTHRRELARSDYNIDGPDVFNCLYVTDYVADIYDHLRELERKRLPPPTYMSLQPDITPRMRAILIDWLADVHLKFNLKPETMYLAVNLCDRFLAKKQVPRQKLQLVGVTAMWLASKYEEIFAPEVKDFVYISDRAYTAEQIIRMQSTMLSKLDFNLTIATPLVFAARFIKAADLSHDMQFTYFVTYLMERTLQEYRFLKYLPSMVAASCVYVALRVLRNSHWTTQLEVHTEYTEEQLRSCIADVYEIGRHSPNASLRAVYRKYSHARYYEISKTPMDL